MSNSTNTNPIYKQIDYDNYDKWISIPMVMNLQQNSVVLMDNFRGYSSKVEMQNKHQVALVVGLKLHQGYFIEYLSEST